MRKLTVVLAAVSAALALIAAIAFAGNGPPKQVWICHFADNHTAPAQWTGGGTTLTGDYVLEYRGGTSPPPRQIAYCLDHGGLGVLQVSAEAAANGHHAQLLDRIAGYPDHLS